LYQFEKALERGKPFISIILDEERDKYSIVIICSTLEQLDAAAVLVAKQETMKPGIFFTEE